MAQTNKNVYKKKKVTLKYVYLLSAYVLTYVVLPLYFELSPFTKMICIS